MKIVVASNNAHKIEEFKSFFKGYDVEILSLKDANIVVDPEENGETFKDNAFIKANEVSKYTNCIVVADDSGLEIHALNGFPGVHSARFMEGHPYVEKFVEINKMLINKDNKANFNCTLCVINLEKNPLYFVGKTYGEILSSPRGDNNFGYDPIFFYPPLNKTFAELTQEEKNKVSHRGNALKQFVDYLKEKNYI